MKIELVVPALPAAGMEMVVARLTEGLSRRGHDVGVTCIVAKGPVADVLAAAGHRVTLVPALGLGTNILPARLARWFRSRKPDVVHIHSGAWLKAARAATMARVPRTVFTMHGFDGTYTWYEPFLERWAAHHTAAIVAVTPALIPYLTEKVGLDENRVRVITNGINIQRYQPGGKTHKVRESFGLSADDVVIGHVARFTPVKNHAVLVRAFGKVLDEQPRAFLALVGDGPLRAETESLVDTLGIRSRVGFMGHISDLRDVYPDLDVFVLSSFSEAASISILEAMAFGLPIVATDVGGTPMLLGHGEAGVLVESDNDRALADGLIALAGAPEQRARLGEAARARVVAYYTEERMIDAYEHLYRGADTS